MAILIENREISFIFFLILLVIFLKGNVTVEYNSDRVGKISQPLFFVCN